MNLKTLLNPTAVAAATALLLSGCGSTGSSSEVKQAIANFMGKTTTSGSSACATGEELSDPPTIHAVNGQLRTQLTAKTVDKCINSGQHQFMSYIDSHTAADTRPVGPAYIIDVDPSKNWPLLALDFSNELSDAEAGNPPYDCSTHHNNPDLKVCTNLHTHGFHVSPESPADNVYLKIAPGEKFDYAFNIPNFHPPGTHWLHAHLHGSTAPQVQEGMAGALILKGDTDRWLASEYGIKGDNDKIMILQQLKDHAGNAPCGDGVQTSVNGQCQPKVTVDAGELQRWRLIHAGISATVNFAVKNPDANKWVPLNEFARDGINMGRMYPQNNLVLQPGYRSDFLIKMPKPGDATGLCPDSGDCTLHIIDAASTKENSFMGVSESDEPIATLVIRDSVGTDRPLPPAQDHHFAKPYPEITDVEIEESAQVTQQIWFANEPDGSKTVNGFVFPHGDTTQLTLDKAQTWKVWVGKNQTGAGNHPFHIHVNPFEVIKRDQFGNIYQRFWKDTILINSMFDREDSPVELRTRYENFTGKFVLHCHNLNHEDAGMMKSVEINP